MNKCTLVFLFALVSVTLCCFNLCGSSCGGCGGCGGGRKKRAIEALPPPPFTNLAAKDTDALCNSPELKEIIVTNMRDTAAESGKSVSAALERHGDRYVVICSETAFEYFIRHDTEFCGARNGTHYCQAFAI